MNLYILCIFAFQNIHNFNSVKRNFLLAVMALAALMAASCQKEEMGRILTATIEQYESDSKAYIDSDNYACWNNGDLVNINGNPYTISIANGAGRANTATIVGSDNLTGNLMAFYPASMADMNNDGTGGTVSLPPMQTYRESNGHQVIDNPMAAYCPDGSNELRFRNLAALLKVTIHADEDLQVRAIQVKGNDNQMLWGETELMLDNQGKPMLGEMSNGSASVHLYFETPDEISAGTNKSFYIVVPAGSNFFNFTIAVMTRQGDAYVKTSNVGQTLPRNHIGAITYTSDDDDKVTAILYMESIEGFNPDVFEGVRVVSSDNGIIIFDGALTSIGNSAFRFCSGLTSISLPDNLTSIGNYAFYGCSGLTSITLLDSLTSIGNYAFKGCSGLCGSIIMPDNLTTIGNYAFYNCSNLSGSITMPDNLTTIGNYAFAYCRGLGSISLPDNLTTIGESAFYECSGLTSISLPDNLTSIGDFAFQGCSSLTSISLPYNLTSIGNYAFSLCSSLDTVYANRWVENGDPEITPFGYDMFNRCGALSHIYVPAGALEAYQTGWGEPYSGMIAAQTSK